jgi:hypothetical protein
MAAAASAVYTTQNSLLLKNLLNFYREHNNLDKMLRIINGESPISLRIVDWFTTNYAKKYYTVYDIVGPVSDFAGPVSDFAGPVSDFAGPVSDFAKGVKPISALPKRFKVYVDYKLKLRSYSKKRFDPFCRWDRINIPYKDGDFIQTTIGQLNFFKWAFENEVIGFIETNYQAIERDMNSRNSTSKRNKTGLQASSQKTRKKREELSISATKTIKKEEVEIVVTFN